MTLFTNKSSLEKTARWLCGRLPTCLPGPGWVPDGFLAPWAIGWSPTNTNKYKQIQTNTNKYLQVLVKEWLVFCFSTFCSWPKLRVVFAAPGLRSTQLFEPEPKNCRRRRIHENLQIKFGTHQPTPATILIDASQFRHQWGVKVCPTDSNRDLPWKSTAEFPSPGLSKFSEDSRQVHRFKGQTKR